jgi:hypothetical protein
MSWKTAVNFCHGRNCRRSATQTTPHRENQEDINNLDSRRSPTPGPGMRVADRAAGKLNERRDFQFCSELIETFQQ